MIGMDLPYPYPCNRSLLVYAGWSTETLYKDASGATLVGGLGTGVRVIKAGTQDYDAMEEAAKVRRKAGAAVAHGG